MLHRIFGLTAALLLLCASHAEAQLFGDRTLGEPFQPQQGTLIGGSDMEGTLQGDERFIRGNRTRRQFVGADRVDQQGFVGAGQAIGMGSVPSAVESLQPLLDRSRAINTPLGLPGPNERAHPRLIIDFAAASPAHQARVREVSQRLKATLADSFGIPIEVSVEGQKATLRGEVASARQKEMIEILVSFEPGIYEVENELQFPASQVSPDLTQ